MSVGGTSGNPATSSNVLSMNLGGVNVNYDLGSSVDTVANNAYAFVNNSFNSDSALLGNTIIGSQNMLKSFANPVIQMAQQQQQFNTQQLPSMFDTLNSQNYTLGSEALSTESQIAQASIQSSAAETAQASSAGGGFCFITTAVCKTLGLPDDCYTLTTLRRFRDTYMQQTSVRRSFVREYYLTCRRLPARIFQRVDLHRFCETLYTDYILPALICIENGDNDRAFKIYRHLVYHVRAVCP